MKPAVLAVFAVMIYVWYVLFFVSKYSTPDEPSSEDTRQDTDKDKEESKPTEESPTEPDNIPLASFVVDIEGEKEEEDNAESVM